MVNRRMNCRRQFVLMASNTVNSSLIGIGNDHLHGDTCGYYRVDIAGGVVTGGAVITMGGQDIRPVLDRMAVGAGLIINHAKVGHRIDLNRMVDNTATAAMIMTGKGPGMTVLTLAAAGNG